jgi:hypothetical protein
MSFDALSQIEKHEAAELLYLKKAKEQRKAANLLRKQYKVKQEAEIVSIEEPAVPDVVIAQPVAAASPTAPPPMPEESPAPSPAQMPRDFKELPIQAPGAPVKKARKPLSQAHKDAMQAGRQKKKAEKDAVAAAAVASEQSVNRILEFLTEPLQLAVPQNEMVVGEAPPSAAAKKPRSPKGKQDTTILEARKAINIGVKIPCERLQVINKHLGLKGADKEIWGYTKASELSRIAAKYGEDVMNFVGDEAGLLALLKSKDASITFPQ